MGLGLLLGVGYGLVAIVAMGVTYLEQVAQGIEGILQRSAGLLACAVWPLVAAVIVAMVMRDGRRHAVAPRRD